MSGPPIYQLRGVVKKHSNAFSLRIDDLQIQRGEVLALLGPTGAGKSTLLRLLAGLDKPACGERCFEGHSIDASDLPLATRRRITMVHQRPMLLTDTVRFNVEYGLRLRGRKDAEHAASAMLDRLALSEIASQHAQTLSGGQTQLVALARALALEPELLLLDEPTTHLDPSHVLRVEHAVRTYQQERSASVVWATHNLFQARRISTGAALLLDGQLVEVAATEAFFESPAERRTSDFLEGRMVY